jgi:hypothetical protein
MDYTYTDTLNEIANKKLIRLDPTFQFGFLDSDNNIYKHEHPAMGYYLKTNDVSINLVISLKWALWGYYFFQEISDAFPFYDKYLIFTENIQNGICIDDTKKKHQLILDDKVINKETFVALMETVYNGLIFDENSKIHFKLKINLDEFLLLSNNDLHPTLIKF